MHPIEITRIVLQANEDESEGTLLLTATDNRTFALFTTGLSGGHPFEIMETKDEATPAQVAQADQEETAAENEVNSTTADVPDNLPTMPQSPTV